MGYMLVFVYVNLMLSKMNCVEQRFWLSVIGILRSVTTSLMWLYPVMMMKIKMNCVAHRFQLSVIGILRWILRKHNIWMRCHIHSVGFLLWALWAYEFVWAYFQASSQKLLVFKCIAMLVIFEWLVNISLQQEKIEQSSVGQIVIICSSGSDCCPTAGLILSSSNKVVFSTFSTMKLDICATFLDTYCPFSCFQTLFLLFLDP